MSVPQQYGTCTHGIFGLNSRSFFFFFFLFLLSGRRFFFPPVFTSHHEFVTAGRKYEWKQFFLMRTFSVAFKIGSRHQTEKRNNKILGKEKRRKQMTIGFLLLGPEGSEKNDCKVRRVVFHRFWCNTWSPPTWQMMEETQLMNKEKKNVLNPMINQTP